MIVSIILTILKIIGITLLCILGFILLAILLVLFVPIRYKVTAEGNINQNEKDYHAKAKVTWLLSIIHGKYEYPGEDGFILKAGPFTIMGKKEKLKKKKTHKSNSKRFSKAGEDSSKHEESVYTNESIESEADTADVNTSGMEDVKLLEEMTEEKIPKKKRRRSFKEKINYTWHKIYDKIKSIWCKIKNIFHNIKKYITILQSEECENALSLCKDSIARIFKMIKPRKVRINGTVGLQSPEQTGYVCAAVGIISPFYKKQIYITPDFENFIIDGKVLIKGRIYLFIVLIIAIKVFFDKNIRKVIEMFRREES